MSDDPCVDGVVDDLPGLLRGELTRDRTRAVVAHLRGCAGCRRELAEVVAAHAALASAARALGGRSLDPADRTSPKAGARPPDGGMAALPPLARPDGRRRLALAAVAAVVIVALALGVSALGGHWPRSRGPSAVVTRSVSLAPVPTSGGPVDPGATGRVSMTGAPGETTTGMTITTTGLPAPGQGNFYYAWLLDPVTNKMLPLGVVPSGATARFVVASDLVSRYAAVDISLQADNGDPAHSATSVLRAAYAS